MYVNFYLSRFSLFRRNFDFDSFDWQQSDPGTGLNSNSDQHSNCCTAVQTTRARTCTEIPVHQVHMELSSVVTQYVLKSRILTETLE